MNGTPSENCTLRAAAGRGEESCPRETCAFWEPGGAVVDGGCGVERLALDVRRADVASFLLDLRERLELIRDSDKKGALRWIP
jgi:hypothetical protein